MKEIFAQLLDAFGKNRIDEIVLLNDKLKAMEREVPQHRKRCTYGDYVPNYSF
jgi:hypothetical protein